MDHLWLAFGLTLGAGMATGIGSIIAFTAKRTDFRLLSIATGFSAGVMLYVSFVEILAKGMDELVDAYGQDMALWANAGSFFAGILLIALIDRLVPSFENPHEPPTEQVNLILQDTQAPSLKNQGLDAAKLQRMGLFTALAITIHNFPEGMATFLAALKDPSAGIAIAIALALHNIPEGISVSVPIFFATGKKRSAFVYSVLSGLAEPVGAGVGYLAIRLAFGGESGLIPPQVMGLLFGAVAGIMVYISLDELLPTSRAYGKEHDSLIGLVLGMALMALSLILMA